MGTFTEDSTTDEWLMYGDSVSQSVPETLRILIATTTEENVVRTHALWH